VIFKRLLHFSSIYALISALAAGALLIDTWPSYPRSFLQWGLLLLIGLPVTVLGDWLSDRALSNSLARAIEGRTKDSQLSWLRIGYYLALYMLFAICAVAVLYWLESRQA